MISYFQAFFLLLFWDFVVLTVDMRPYNIEIDKKKGKQKREQKICTKRKNKIEIKKYNFCEHNEKYCISTTRHPLCLCQYDVWIQDITNVDLKNKKQKNEE